MRRRCVSELCPSTPSIGHRDLRRRVYQTRQEHIGPAFLYHRIWPSECPSPMWTNPRVVKILSRTGKSCFFRRSTRRTYPEPSRVTAILAGGDAVASYPLQRVGWIDRRTFSAIKNFSGLFDLCALAFRNPPARPPHHHINSYLFCRRRLTTV